MTDDPRCWRSDGVAERTSDSLTSRDVAYGRGAGFSMAQQCCLLAGVVPLSQYKGAGARHCEARTLNLLGRVQFLKMQLRAKSMPWISVQPRCSRAGAEFLD